MPMFRKTIAVGLVLALLSVLVGCPQPQPPLPKEHLRVLLLEETAQRDKLSAGQLDILLATGDGSVRSWLARHKVPYRLFDQDANLALQDAGWQWLRSEARARNLTVPCWIIGYWPEKRVLVAEPLPASMTDAIRRLESLPRK